MPTTVDKYNAISTIMSEPIVFHFGGLTNKQFENLCKSHPDLKFELDKQGDLIIVPPTSLDAGWKNSELIIELGIWSRLDETGIIFDSSTMFTLPNGAKRSPDVSWMTKEKYNSLSDAEKKTFSKIVPDFVIELRSPSDNLNPIKNKMSEYINNGVKLGWLIDPEEKTVHIYRANGEIEILNNPELVSGENILHGFALDISRLW
ncbi:MAG: Uma2 family endonuclease [Aridibacter sp.]